MNDSANKYRVLLENHSFPLFFQINGGGQMNKWVYEKDSKAKLCESSQSCDEVIFKEEADCDCSRKEPGDKSFKFEEAFLDESTDKRRRPT